MEGEELRLSLCEGLVQGLHPREGEKRMSWSSSWKKSQPQKVVTVPYPYWEPLPQLSQLLEREAREEGAWMIKSSGCQGWGQGARPLGDIFSHCVLRTKTSLI